MDSTQQLIKRDFQNGGYNEIKCIINKVDVAESFSAGAKVADIVVSGGTSPYSYSLASGGDYFQISGTEVQVKDNMDIDNIQSFSVTATDSTSGTALTVTSEETYPNLAAEIQSRFNSAGKIYKITQDIDLGNGILTIPSGCTLDFQGGSIINGIIVGNNTKIKAGLEKIFNTNIILSKSWDVEGLYPEWFGAIPYKKNIINNITSSIFINGNIKESNNAFITINNVLINTNVHTVLLNNLYYITNGIDICITEYYNTGVTFIGNGTDTGFIVQMNNNNATALSINNNKNNTISQSDYLFNFSIYITNNSNLKSALSLYNTIRSTCRDIKIYGGYANFQKGLFHIHSAKNQNVFQNIFDGCVGMNTTTGGGLHYSQDTYQPTLQSISNCVFASLGGAGIESEPTDITGGGFGGIITANELEGNAKGAIAISSVYNLSVTNNYFEFADYSNITNYFENVPPAIFTFGIISSNNKGYITNVYNLTISNNQFGSPKGSIEYAFIFNSSVTGGRTFNVRIINNIINNNISDNIGCKYITKIQNCYNVVISNNQFVVNYSDVNPDFPIELTTNGEVYYENNNNIITYGKYNYSYSKGTAILRTNAFTTVNNYPYLIPVNQYKENIVDSGDFIFLEHNNTIYKVIQGGKLHYNTNASFVENSNVVTCSGAIWNWSIGDTVNSEYINNRTAVITNIEGNSITLSENAIATINDWLTDAIIIPYELSSSIKTNGSSSNRPTYKSSKITIGFQYFDTTLQKPIWWTGSKWVDATGADV